MCKYFYGEEVIFLNRFDVLKFAMCSIQRSPLLCAPGLVKFVPAVARLFCLALPGSFLTMFAQNKVELCRGTKYLLKFN